MIKFFKLEVIRNAKHLVFREELKVFLLNARGDANFVLVARDVDILHQTEQKTT